MAATQAPDRTYRPDEARAALLAGLPVTERRLTLAGIATSVLEGGDGPPVVLLHGPGESGAKWLRVIPDLVTTHRVIAPDLPAHGNSDAPDPIDVDGMLAWLGALIESTCDAPPVVVGHVLGGAIAARFAAAHVGRLDRLVLVDTLGLRTFRPAPRFLLTMAAFLARPTEATYDRFMQQCSYDLDDLRAGMGERWEPFVAYNLHGAREGKDLGRLMRLFGIPRIATDDLARIGVPTDLIWGRHDRATRVTVAQEASRTYGWPLHVVEECADDPPRDRPSQFVHLLRTIMREGSR